MGLSLPPTKIQFTSHMSQEWNNPTGSTPEQQPQQSQQTPVPPASTYKPQTGSAAPAGRPKRNNTWIYAGIIALLLGTNVYLFMNKNKVTGERQAAMVERDSAVNTRDAVKTEYDAAIARLDQLNTTNDQLNNEIKDKDGDLQKLRSQLQGIMSKQHRSESENAKAKALIAKLNSKVSSYESRIASLEGENRQLTSQNSTLTDEKNQVVTENTGLQQKVKLGAVLHASNIRMEAIDMRRHGTKERETSKARKTDLLRVIFDIDENRIAESGSKEVLLRITAPDGRLLSNAAYGSGVTTTEDGQQLSYTLARQINLTTNTPVRDVSVDWNQDNDYQRGTYAIDIYNSGFRIGGGSVTLK
jgi:predicted nuclease with TOPRIM domain